MVSDVIVEGVVTSCRGVIDVIVAGGSDVIAAGGSDVKVIGGSDVIVTS